MPKLANQKDWNYWYDRVYGYFYRRLNSRFETEELTAETLNAYFLKESEISNSNAFMWQIAKNKLYTFFKKKTRDKGKTIDIDDEYLENISTGDDYSSHFQAKMAGLWECIAKYLKTQDQQILRMCIQEDFSSADVAKTLNLKAPNVRKRLSRAVKKLKLMCAEIWLNN